VNWVFALMEYGAALIGIYLPTFRDSLSFLFSRSSSSRRNCTWTAWSSFRNFGNYQ